MNRSLPTTAFLASILLLTCACGDRGDVPAPISPPVSDSGPTPPPPPAPSLPVSAAHEIALTDLGARITDEGLLVTLPSADFASGESAFEPTSSDRIDAAAELLAEHSDLKMIVRGYTDNRGDAKANLKLSQDRAEAVKQYIVTRSSVEASRIEAKGMGEADPVASNDSEDGRSQNRRVVLRIVDQSGHYTSRAGARPSG